MLKIDYVAQGTYVAASVGFDPETLRTRGTEHSHTPTRGIQLYNCVNRNLIVND